MTKVNHKRTNYKDNSSCIKEEGLKKSKPDEKKLFSILLKYTIAKKKKIKETKLGDMYKRLLLKKRKKKKEAKML